MERRGRATGRKKNSLLILGLALAFLSCALISGCNWKKRQHDWETTWSSDDEKHWHACLSCDERKSVGNHDYDSGGICICGKSQFRYQLNENGTYTVSGAVFIPKHTPLVIPAKYQGKAVTAIAPRAFWGDTNMTGVEIPDSVTHIGEDAFRRCSGLTRVVIPKSVRQISGNAFADCSNLKRIDVDEENSTYKSEKNCILTVDGKTLVLGCKSSVIPNGITRIGDYAFAGCNLEVVKVPNSVTSIGNHAFSDCSRLGQIEVLGDVGKIRITSIGDGVFSNCTRLTQMAIPFGVTAIPDATFFGCDSLESVEIPNGVTRIGKSAFSGCSKLKRMVIPFGVTAIPEAAFFGCDSLESVEIPNGVTRIGKSAFSGCSKLKRMEIPDGLTSIGALAFADCFDLESLVIPFGVTRIDVGTFVRCENLSKIEIPVSVKEIDWGAFYDCKSLTRIDYAGRKALWEEIIKVDIWNYDTCDECTIYCTDGEMNAKRRNNGITQKGEL